MDTEYGTEMTDDVENEAVTADDTEAYPGEAAAIEPAAPKYTVPRRKPTLSFFTRAGLFSVKVGAAVLLGLITAVKLVLSELWELAVSLFRAVLWLLREISSPMRNRFKVNKRLQKKVQKARRESKEEYNKALAYFWCSYLFGEDGVFYTAFNYILPVISIAFLIGIVRYGSGLEYGLSVEYNGKEIGVIKAEADFEAAEREVQQRISYDDSNEVINLSAKYSLRIINENDTIVSAGQLANEMLASSDEELLEADGIYIDGKFIGAVRDKEPIQDALNERILNYRVDGIVKDLSYKNQIEYSRGIYLAESVMEKDEAIKLLTSEKEKRSVYIAQSGDTAAMIAQKYNMDFEKLEELNPDISRKCRKGMIVNVIETESYLPIKYVREMDPITFLDYETIEVETSSLNAGVRDIIVKGRRGEKTSHIEVTYVDGKEYSRKTISTKITKQPVVEQIGIGIYAARPDSPSTVLTGSGQFGWPVDGGWVSDGFGGARNHKGMDIAASTGTEIYAAADGVVVSAGWNTGGYGYFVQIGHQDEYQTVYGHMSAVLVDEGQYVTRGQLIGEVGNTGNSFGSHCHFEVRHLGMCLDPELFLNTVDSFSEESEKNRKKNDKKKN